MKPYVQRRLATLDADTTGEQPVYDLDYLKSLGGEKIAERLEERVAKAKADAKDGEDEPQPEPEERAEEDLASQVQLPAAPEQQAAAKPALAADQAPSANPDLAANAAAVKTTEPDNPQ